MKLVDMLVQSYCDTIAACEVAKEDGIWVCDPFPKGVQIYENIEKLAKEAEQEITITPKKDERDPFEKSFTYGGILFYQIGPESCETEFHTDTEKELINAK